MTDVYEVNCDAQPDMNKYLSGLPEHNVDNVHVSTWESLYPFMPERLLAMWAVETHGCDVPSDTDTCPPHIVGLPYRHQINYNIHGTDHDGRVWSVWEHDSCENVEEVVARYQSPNTSFVAVVTNHHWIIELPGKMSADIRFRPVKPIELISVTLDMSKFPIIQETP